MKEVDYTNNTSIIKQHPKMTAVNSCIEVDITGQVCSDSIGTRMFSGELLLLRCKILERNEIRDQQRDKLSLFRLSQVSEDKLISSEVRLKVLMEEGNQSSPFSQSTRKRKTAKSSQFSNQV